MDIHTFYIQIHHFTRGSKQKERLVRKLAQRTNA